ncbi:hypothetical protein [Kitasatospora sp. NPDC058190]|uniref:hypothetical protein n=1 Tax=Kitasatospora sp. NPDC058190 TaxID=3346371 RepID=UPI0036DE2D5D
MDDQQAECRAGMMAGRPLPSRSERAMPRPTEEPHPDGGAAAGGLGVAVADEWVVRIVTVAGELDHDRADGLRTALGRFGKEGTERIMVGLAELRF